MSTTSNSFNGIRKDMEWEQRIISPYETMDWGHQDIIEMCRDWLLGGMHSEWRYSRSKLDGSLILERR